MTVARSSALNVGAPVRLRLWGGGEGAGLVRREDWDSLSDWGQLVRLKLGCDAAPLALWVGALEGYSLLSGHLVRRYSNRTNPDYHPAGAFLTGTAGAALRGGLRLGRAGRAPDGGEAAVDVQHVLFGEPAEPGRYTLALSAVHDWGRAGGRSARGDAGAPGRDGGGGGAARASRRTCWRGWGGRPGRGWRVGRGGWAWAWMR